jgi:hypothetical protein
MRRTCLSIALAIVGLFTVAPSAYAEFLTYNSKSTGSTAYSELNITDGLPAVHCLALGSSAPTWQIRNSAGEAANSGPRLLLKIKTVGECTVEVFKSLVEAKISSNECEVGVIQTKEEEKVNGWDDSTCTLKVEIKKEVCEVSIEPSSNKELKEVLVDRSGLESKDMLMHLNMKGVTTTVKGAGCATNGITATKEATLEGWSEVLEASIIGPGAPFSVYLLETNPFVSVKGRAKAFVTVRWENNPLEATPGEALKSTEEFGTGNWTISKETLVFCKAKTYNTTQPECRMLVELAKEPPAGKVYAITISATWASRVSEERIIGVR